MNPIDEYLKNLKPNATSDADFVFYQRRVEYYGNLLEQQVVAANGYGEIKFELDHAGIYTMYKYWKTAMISFIENQGVQAYRSRNENRRQS